MFAVTVAPFVFAYLAYQYWQPAGRSNHGELIEPRILPTAPLVLLNGKPFQLADLKGKWLMIHADSGACAESCRKQLYFMRQVRLAQGKNFDRIERVWLITDGAQPPADLAPLVEGVWLVRAAGAPIVVALPGMAAVSDHIFLVDPRGNLMLRFPRDPDPAGMIKDLQRLLKLSRVG
jgi:cytochrome oxidase Cu insertion factor (SCO1/SenC/PrrC family)